MSMQPYVIAGSDIGLELDEKFFLLPDKALPVLNNAYVWRNRIRKREGIKILGRLRRVLTSQSLGNTTVGATTNIADVLSTFHLGSEPNAELQPGTLVITVGGTDAATYTDQGDGTFAVTGKGDATGSYVNYATGAVVLKFSPVAVGGQPITADFNYYPLLPVMGITQRERANLNNEETLFFDQRYCYTFNGTAFTEYLSAAGVTWNGSNSQFFWGTNFQASDPSIRNLWVTNFNLDPTGNPMRYTNGSTWNTFEPLISSTDSLYSARILLPYYGRLIALNTFEGTTRATSKQFFNRCRFSQIGDPTQTLPAGEEAWREDVFGKGGFIDAPTNEEIVSASFFKNTLIVFFERSTWQLRYVGDYGLPFVFEKISSDFGSESQFSPVVFDEAVLAVGNRAIIQATSQSTDRIDEKIPDIVFGLRNANQGVDRVHGVRNFYKELVYWNYNDSTDTDSAVVFPNKLLLFNYRNGSWAILRTNSTCFGIYSAINAITWSRTDIYWNNYEVFWKDPDNQTLFPFTVIGNQQGYIHILNQQDVDNESLTIADIDRTVTPPRITSYSNNLNDGEIIYIEGLDFIEPTDSSDVTTDLNDKTYKVRYIDPISTDIFEIVKWNTATQTYVEDFSYTPASGTGTYIGGGKITILPKMEIATKDFNPFLQNGKQMKLSYVDFLTDETSNGQVNVKIFSGTTTKEEANLIVGQKNFDTQVSPLFTNNSENMNFNRFYSTVFGNFINVFISYDDDQMNDRSIYDQPFVLNAIIMWLRQGGRIAN